MSGFNRRKRRKALRSIRYYHHYRNRIWPVAVSARHWQIMEAVDGTWLTRVQWPTNIYRNPMLAQLTLYNSIESWGSVKTFESYRTRLKSAGLSAEYWAAAAGRQRNPVRREACLWLAKAMVGAKTYREGFADV